MHILIDARFWGTGTGIATYTENLIKNLARIDQKNHYSVVLENRYFDRFYFVAPNFNKLKIKAPHYSLAEQILLFRLIEKVKPDLVHFTNFNHPLLYQGLCVFTIHDLILSLFPPPENIIKKLAYQIVIRSALKKADKVIAVSQNTKKDLQKIFNLKADEIKVIYHGVEKPRETFSQKEVDLFKKKYSLKPNYLLYVGRFAAHKNVGRLIRAFYKLKKNYQIAQQLVLVGPLEKEYPSLKRLVENYHLESEVIFTGAVDRKGLSLLYKGAELFICPSLYEGFGLPVLEAMSYGVPVVCSRVASLPEIALHAAVYFDPYNTNEIAEKIYEVLKDQRLKRYLVREGERRCNAFSWAKTARETLRVYQSLVK